MAKPGAEAEAWEIGIVEDARKNFENHMLMDNWLLKTYLIEGKLEGHVDRLTQLVNELIEMHVPKKEI